MGDGSDHADVDRWLRSEEGKAHLERVRSGLTGRTITDVRFENATAHVVTVLSLDDGNAFEGVQPAHDVAALRHEFEETIEREYYRDYPERRPDHG